MRSITFCIDRFDGQKKYEQEYQLHYEKGKTILGWLIKIKEEVDPTLSFTASCRSGICGACAVRVNGQAVLACETPLDDILKQYQEDQVAIAPLGNYRVIRDLVVDWEPKVEKLQKMEPWLNVKLEFTNQTGCRQSVDNFHEVREFSDCILCGACASECNKLSADDSDFAAPFMFAKAQKYAADSRDQKPSTHVVAALNQGLWKCMHCNECVSKCPKNLKPAEYIAKIRQASIKLGKTDQLGARHAKAFYDDVYDTGRLNEMKLGLRTEGMLKSMTRLPFALKMMKRGKLNPLHRPTKIEGIQQVRAILDAVKEEK